MATDDHLHPDGHPAELIHRNRPNDHFVMIPNGTVRNRGVSYLARAPRRDALPAARLAGGRR
jgi:hypothetical protein